MDDIPIKLYICEYNNITNLKQEVLIISKRSICEHYELKYSLIKLYIMESSLQVINLLLEAFIKCFYIFFYWISHLGSKG
jgi:hypothetical protein